MQKSANVRNGKDTCQDYRFLITKAWKRNSKRNTKKSLDESVLEYEQMVNDPHLVSVVKRIESTYK